MKTSMVRGVVAAVAAALGLGMVGAVVASAQASTQEASITLTAPVSAPEAVNGHTFTAVNLGKYDLDALQPLEDGTYAGVNVTTNDTVKGSILEAAKTVAGSDGDKVDANNPMAWVAQHYSVSGAGADPQWSGEIRKFVDALASKPDVLSALSSPDAPRTTGSGGSATFSNLPTEGMYLVQDITAGLGDDAYSQSIPMYSQSIPMLVGTKIDGKDLKNQTLGTVEVKNQLPTFEKALVKPGADHPWAGVGDDVEWNLSGTVPNYTGYTGGYDYTFSDTLSRGLSFGGIDKVKVTVGGYVSQEG